MATTINEKRIAELHPVVADKAREWLRRVEAEGFKVMVVQGLRTIEEQNALYAQGRTKPGAIVTNAKGGYSYHNYGLAFDFCMLKADGSLDWIVGQKWLRIAAIAKELGFEWGGDWTGSLIDNPHFQYTFGLSVNDLLAGKRPPEPQEEKYMLSEDHANDIIKILSNYWLEMQGNLEVQNYTHFLANEVRKAAGIEVED
jgi:hypothetical protein